MINYTGRNRTTLTFLNALYLPQGGLMLHAECEPDVSLENIDTICTVLEQIC